MYLVYSLFVHKAFDVFMLMSVIKCVVGVNNVVTRRQLRFHRN